MLHVHCDGCVLCNAVFFIGTPATMSQLAKDVSTFLRWAAGLQCLQF